MSTTIALISDFGTRDWFVGVMKGVISRISPHVSIIDITHECLRGDIVGAAFILAQSLRYFPQETVFCVVVDPGVGSARNAISCRAGDYMLVGPDNGVLSYVTAQYDVKSIVKLTNPDYFLEPVSTTFHGRDIFAPVSAHLANGVPLNKIGKTTKKWKNIRWPEIRINKDSIEGGIIYIDRFGNAFSNITPEHIKKIPSGRLEVKAGKADSIPLCTHYAEQSVGNALALINASGYLEIAVNSANASKELGLTIGNKAVLRVV